MGPTVMMAMKDIRLLLRDKGGLFWLVAFPILNAVIWGLISGGGGKGKARLKLVAVDEDGSKFARVLVGELRKSESIEVEELPRGEARDRVRTGKAAAAVVLAKGAGEMNGLGVFFAPAGGEKIELMIDPAQQVAGGMLQGLLVQSMFSAITETVMDPRLMRDLARDGVRNAREGLARTDPAQAENLARYLESTERFLDTVDPGFYRGGIAPQPDAADGGKGGGAAASLIRIRQTVLEAPAASGPRSPFDVTFPASMLWAVIGGCAAFAISLVVETEKGTMRRLLAAPVSQKQIIAGKGLACLVTCLAMMCLLLVLGLVGFGVSLRSLPMFLAGALTTSIAFVGVMMFLTTLGRTERAVGGSAWGILLVMMMFGGGMVPLMFMPKWMAALSNLSPAKWGIYCIEAGVWRDLSWGELMAPYAILLGIGVAGFMAGARSFAMRNA